MFNRFASKRALPGAVDNDDDDKELQDIARKRLGTPTPAAIPKPTVTPTAPRSAVTSTAPATRPAPAPAPAPKPLPPAPTLAQPKPPAPAPKPPERAVPTDRDRELRMEAIKRMSAGEDSAGFGARSGFAMGIPGAVDRKAPDDGGITVSGNGNREDLPEEYGETLDETVNREYGGGGGGINVPDDAKDDEPVYDTEVNDNLDRDHDLTVGPGDGLPDRSIGGDDEGMEDVARARLEAEQKAEQDAARAELEAGKAKNLMIQNARAQLGGFGLSGATASLESDIARKADRSITLAMGDLKRSGRDEGREDRRIDNAEKRANAEEQRAQTNDEWMAVQRRMAISLLEEEMGEDLNNDGVEGFDGTPGGRQTPAEAAEDLADHMADNADDFMDIEDLNSLPVGSPEDHPRAYWIDPNTGEMSQTPTSYFWDPETQQHYRVRR